MHRAQSERQTEREREGEKVYNAVCKRNVVEAAKTKSASARVVVVVAVVI